LLHKDEQDNGSWRNLQQNIRCNVCNQSFGQFINKNTTQIIQHNRSNNRCCNSVVKVSHYCTEESAFNVYVCLMCFRYSKEKPAKIKCSCKKPESLPTIDAPQNQSEEAMVQPINFDNTTNDDNEGGQDSLFDDYENETPTAPTVTDHLTNKSLFSESASKFLLREHINKGDGIRGLVVHARINHKISSNFGAYINEEDMFRELQNAKFMKDAKREQCEHVAAMTFDQSKRSAGEKKQIIDSFNNDCAQNIIQGMKDMESEGEFSSETLLALKEIVVKNMNKCGEEMKLKSDDRNTDLLIDYPSIRNQVLEGKNSIIQNLPLPKVHLENNFACVPLEAIVNLSLALDLGVREYVDDKDWVDSNGEYDGSFYKNLHQKVKADKDTRVCIIRVWSDGFEAYKTRQNSDKNQIQTFTVTLMGKNGKNIVWPFALGFKSKQHSLILNSLRAQAKELEEKKLRYSGNEKCLFPYSFYLQLIANDYVERVAHTGVSSNGNFTKRWMHTCSYDSKDTPSCPDCRQRRVDRVLATSSDGDMSRKRPVDESSSATQKPPSKRQCPSDTSLLAGSTRRISAAVAEETAEKKKSKKKKKKRLVEPTTTAKKPPHKSSDGKGEEDSSRTKISIPWIQTLIGLQLIVPGHWWDDCEKEDKSKLWRCEIDSINDTDKEEKYFGIKCHGDGVRYWIKYETIKKYVDTDHVDYPKYDLPEKQPSIDQEQANSSANGKNEIPTSGGAMSRKRLVDESSSATQKPPSKRQCCTDWMSPTSSNYFKDCVRYPVKIGDKLPSPIPIVEQNFTMMYNCCDDSIVHLLKKIDERKEAIAAEGKRKANSILAQAKTDVSNHFQRCGVAPSIGEAIVNKALTKEDIMVTKEDIMEVIPAIIRDHNNTNLKLFKQLPMHGIFLGCEKKLISMTPSFFAGRCTREAERGALARAYCKANESLKKVRTLSLAWCKAVKFRDEKMSTKKWESENYVACTRISLVLFSAFDVEREDIGQSEILDRIREMRVLWFCLVSHLFAEEKVAPEIVDDYVKLFLSSCVSLHLLTRREVGSRKSITTRNNEENQVFLQAEAFKAKLDAHQGLNKKKLTDCHESELKTIYDVHWKQSDHSSLNLSKKPTNDEIKLGVETFMLFNRKPLSIEEHLIDNGHQQGIVTEVLTNNAQQLGLEGDDEQPSRGRSVKYNSFFEEGQNFFSLLNLKDVIEECGSFRALWEGGVEGEKFIQFIKSAFGGAFRHNHEYMKITLKKLLRDFIFDKINEDNPHSKRESNNRTLHYTTYDESFSLDTCEGPVSGVIIENKLFICFDRKSDSRTESIVTLKEVVFRQDGGSWYYNLWYQSIEELEDARTMSLRNVSNQASDFFILFPLYEDCGKSKSFTLICKSWRIRDDLGKLRLPTPNISILTSNENS